jgi:uncharacterized protein with PIN domain
MNKQIEDVVKSMTVPELEMLIMDLKAYVGVRSDVVIPEENVDSSELHFLSNMGKSFRCECGCNVFHHPRNLEEYVHLLQEGKVKSAKDIYLCNACGVVYWTEEAK